MASLYDTIFGGGTAPAPDDTDDTGLTPQAIQARMSSGTAPAGAASAAGAANIGQTGASNTTTPGTAPVPTSTPPGMHMSSMTTRSTSGPQSAYLQAPPSDAEVRTVMDQISQVRKQAVTPADMSAVNQAEADAKELYQDKANRAEWSDVAEKIGNAAIKFGQAQAAIHHNVDVSQMKDLAPTDWESRINRYAQDYKTDVDLAEKQRQNARESYNEQNKMSQQDYENQLQPLMDQEKFLQYKYGQESSDYRRGLQEASRDNRLMQMETFKEGAAGNRQGQADDKQLRALQAKDYQEQLKQVQDQEKNAVTASQILSQQEDLDPKALQKLETENPGILGRAGITPDQLTSITQQAQTPGRFFGTNTDPGKRNELIQQQVLQPLRQKEMTLRGALDHVLGTPGRNAPTAGVQTAPGQGTGSAMATPGKSISGAQLQDYAQTHFGGNIDAATQFLSNSGYTVGK